MTKTNEAILAIRNNCEGDEYDIIAALKEWANCREAEVDEEGNVWIANPQTGHWLSEDEKSEFIDWANKQ